MGINDLTIGQVKEIQSLLGSSRASEHSLPVGEKVIVRTVTHYYTGRLAAVTATDIVLEDAAWIADTGRWADVLQSGCPNEVEPFLDPVIVSRGAIVDVTLWRNELLRTQK